MTYLKRIHAARITLTFILGVGLVLTPPATLVASADPGSPLHTIVVQKNTRLSGNSRHVGGAITPYSTSTDLGGVTAYSTGGLQYREGIFNVDSSGLTESATSSAVTELETHGALIHSYNTSNCYDGDYLYIVPSTYTYNTTDDNPGWTPFETTAKTNCLTMVRALVLAVS